MFVCVWKDVLWKDVEYMENSDVNKHAPKKEKWVKNAIHCSLKIKSENEIVSNSLIHKRFPIFLISLEYSSPRMFADDMALNVSGKSISNV